MQAVLLGTGWSTSTLSGGLELVNRLENNMKDLSNLSDGELLQELQASWILTAVGT